MNLGRSHTVNCKMWKLGLEGLLGERAAGGEDGSFLPPSHFAHSQCRKNTKLRKQTKGRPRLPADLSPRLRSGQDAAGEGEASAGLRAGACSAGLGAPAHCRRGAAADTQPSALKCELELRV